LDLAIQRAPHALPSGRAWGCVRTLRRRRVKRERCPKCGGRLDVEGESWSRAEGTVERSFRCRACGERFGASVRWTYPGSPSQRTPAKRRFPAPVLGWLSLALVILWLVLRSLDYGSVRVSVYGIVARGAEAFLHPAWAALLLGLAAFLFLVARKRSVPLAVPAAVAPAVQLRAEPPGMISVVVAGSRDAVARDSVVERNPSEEERVVEAFHALAQRSAAFAGANESGSFSRAQIDDAQRELYALGIAIGGTLLGGESDVADALLDLPGDHLQLGVQAELSGIPWELMVAHMGGEFLWQRFSVTRQLRDTAVVRRGPVKRAGRCRLLLLANLEASVPGRELPAAEREAAELLELGATKPDLLRVMRKSPRSGAELRQLLGEGFDVLHFAGHTDAVGGLERGWVLGDGTAVSPAELLTEAVPAPTIVFANACSSNLSSRGESVTDAARALMLAGVPAYLCTLAELHDAGSADFSLAFYGAVLGGATLGAALTAARTALLGRHPITWANYVLYGDPALTLCGSSSAQFPAKNPGHSGD